MRNQTDIPPYLVVKANAARLPLQNDSVDLVIATPPYFGARLLRRGDFCTSDAGEYERMIGAFLAEALRVVKSEGRILFAGKRPRSPRRRGARKLDFQVLRKQRQRGRWALKEVRRHSFWTHGQILKTTCWMAIPGRIYRSLVKQYSEQGQIVAHVFSGSGNGGIAAVSLKRKAVLVDLHYHREVLKRLKRKCGAARRS